MPRRKQTADKNAVATGEIPRDPQMVQDALQFAIDRTFEIIEGREDFDSICERVYEVYSRFYDDINIRDGSEAMHAWWKYLNENCKKTPERTCIDCRKGMMEVALDYEEYLEKSERALREKRLGKRLGNGFTRLARFLWPALARTAPNK